MAYVQRSEKAMLEPQTKKTAPGSFSVLFYLQDRKKLIKTVNYHTRGKSWSLSLQSRASQANQKLGSVFALK